MLQFRHVVHSVENSTFNCNPLLCMRQHINVRSPAADTTREACPKHSPETDRLICGLSLLPHTHIYMCVYAVYRCGEEISTR